MERETSENRTYIDLITGRREEKKDDDKTKDKEKPKSK